MKHACAIVAVLLAAANLHAGQERCLLSREVSAARAALNANDIQTAVKILSPLESRGSECPELILLLGRVRMTQQLPSWAEQLITQYTKLVPADPEGFRTLAQLMFRQGDLTGAEGALAKAIEIQPNSASTLLLASQIWRAEGKEKEVGYALEKASRLAPERPEVHFELGMFLDSHSRHGDAVRAFRKVIALDTSNSSAWDYLALNLEAIGQPEQAEAAFKKGLAVNQSPREDPFLDYNYGRLLMKQNRLTESKTYLDRAVERMPAVRAAHYERAKLLLLMRQYTDARREAEAALNTPDPGQYILDLQVYSLLTAVYQRLGEAQLASKYAQLAREAKVPPSTEGR